MAAYLLSEHFELGLDTTSESTSSSGGNETDLSTSWGVSGLATRLTDVLVVTSSVRVLDWVHGHTSNNRPHLSLWLEVVVNSTGLQDWLLVSSSSSYDTDHGSGLTSNSLLDTGWEFESGLESVLALADDGGESA